MGLAIIVPDMSFGDTNLGKVTLNGNVPIRGLYINLEDSYVGTSVDLKCSYLPTNTTQRNVVWSIEDGSEYASVSGSVLTILPGSSNNNVTVKCTSFDNSSIYATKEITVTYEESGVIWHDITSDMVIGHRAINSSTGVIEYSSKTAREVFLLPIPNNVSSVRFKVIGQNKNQTMTVSFIASETIAQTELPKNATHFTNWNMVNNEEIVLSVQNGDKSIVSWQNIDGVIYGVDNIKYSFL